MSVEENKAIARRYIEEGWSNPKALDDLLAEEIAWPNATVSRDDLKANWSRGRASCPDAQPTIELMVAEGDQVVVVWKAKATHMGGEWMDIPPTNKEVEWFVWTCLQIADGKIVAMRQIWSVLHFLNQLGLAPSFKEIVEQAGGKVPD
ncbi:MAG: ester cyclase [Planctomycetota bacterium]